MINMDIPCRKSKNGVCISVRVQPRSSKKGIDRIDGDVLRVRLTAPPADGAANAQLIEVLADEFRIRKSAFSIVKGQSSRDKIVEVEGPPEGFPSRILD
ncbi:MAG: YggU family protein [Thermodesulfovibrionales bacterium]|nr:YggU family protein [Thermodesulfovibrionales bacterium]